MLILLALVGSVDAFAQDSSQAWVCRAPSKTEGFPDSIELTKEEHDQEHSIMQTIEGQSYVITPQASGVIVSIPKKEIMSYTCLSSPASDRKRYPEMYDCEANKKDSTYPSDFMISERTVATQNNKRPYPIEGSSETEKYFVSGGNEKVELTALMGNLNFKCSKIPALNRVIASEE